MSLLSEEIIFKEAVARAEHD
ncbi:MAG: hypothetical protein JWL66_1263, partial [Sphingomonadales bacterium]|nr:hypothetical protein [Sphingomonadales bacterium]